MKSGLEVIIPLIVTGGAGLLAALYPIIRDLIKMLKNRSEGFKKLVETVHDLTADEKETEKKKKRDKKKS